MPKVILNPNKESNEKLVKTIRKRMIDMDLDSKKLAKCIGVSEGTIRNRFIRPEDFSLKELRRLSTTIHLSLFELLDGEK
jgi:hypothetical protein